MTRGEFECRHCGALFVRANHVELHRGHAHADDLTADEQAAFEAAWTQEELQLDELRKHARGVLYATPFVAFYLFFVIVAIIYKVAHWAVLPAPGVVIFGLLVYYMAYTKEDAPPRPG